MNAIVYSLFGFERGRHKDCFDFNSYLRSFMINIRLNRLIYPAWDIILEIDEATYEGHKELFEWLKLKEYCKIEVNENNVPLTKAMLWRLKPIFYHAIGKWKYDHVICRDLDSPTTYRDRQAVEIWIKNDKTAHAITDSVSHTIPMLGGMVGFKPAYFTERMGAKTWDSLFQEVSIDFSQKGADQTYLNQYVYPKVAQHGNDSITQHYVLGMPKTFLSDYHNTIEDIELPINPELKESNTICGHIGAAGYYETALFKFLRKYWHLFDELLQKEKEYKHIFYWANE